MNIINRGCRYCRCWPSWSLLSLLLLSWIVVNQAQGNPTSKPRFPRDDDAKMNFSNHKLVRIVAKNDVQLKKLGDLEEFFEMDFWGPKRVSQPVLTVVDQHRAGFLSKLNESRIKYEILSNNFQQLVDQEQANMHKARFSRFSDDDFDYKNYHKLEEIQDHLKDLASKSSGNATIMTVGESFENREIIAIKIGSNENPVIMVECGIHSREWISVAFGTWLAGSLLNDKTIAAYAEQFQFIIVPVLNVDGYVYTHTNNRLWRKTRSRRSGTTCVGADPNRNWDSAWCEQGSSKNPCSEIYCGKSPFSEKEAVVMKNLIESEQDNIVAYFAVHSYSQLWMYPYGYKKDLPENADELESYSKAAVNALKSVYGTEYIAGPIATTIYPASGSSIDYAYDNLDVTVAFALELRDKGEYGFQLPASQIEPTCIETWAGMAAIIDQLDSD